VIALAGGTEVRRLLDPMLERADRLHEAMICSPLIDAALEDALARLSVAMSPLTGSLLIITTPAAARSIQRILSATCMRRTALVVPRRKLHAKTYISLARRPRECEAIVTSANLTEAGLGTNIELGVQVLPTSDAGRLLFEQTCRFVRDLAA
jgi:HKD family nuclease